MKWFHRLGVPLLILLINLALLLGNSGISQALIIPLTIDDLAQNADAIIVGTVLERHSQWNAARTQIFTTVTFAVEDTLKGLPGQSQISITVPGGTVGDITQWVEDVPVFEVYERAVLFLKQSPTRGLEVYGQYLGKLPVLADKVNGVPLRDFKEQITGAVRGFKPIPAVQNWQITEQVILDSAVDNVLWMRPNIPEVPSADTRAAGWSTLLSDGFEAPTAYWNVSGNPTW